MAAPQLRRDALLGMLALAGVATSMTVAASWPPMSNQPTRPVVSRLDPNSATWWQLARLPGIGDGVARAIAAARDTGLTFAEPADLARVRGVGRQRAAQLAPFLRFNATGAVTRPGN
ncbi:MAG: helix-hairpin-helix domain-containing protein [Phycisphaerae bacterium]